MPVGGTKGTKQVQVAVGLIERSGAQGREMLLAWREASLHQGNRHEFPGGKVEAGESPRQALLRELHEELGIRVTAAQALREIEHHYPEKTVCLSVFRVTAWQGEPVGQQGQALCWVPVGQLSQYRLPDANAPMVRLAQLPECYAISPVGEVCGAAVPKPAWPLQGWLYVRQPHLQAQAQWQWAQALHEQRPDLHLVVSWPAAASAAKQPWPTWLCGIQLRHAELGQVSAAQVAAWQAQGRVVLAACHDRASLQQAERLGVDAVTLGPVQATPTHPGQPGLGWAAFAAWVAEARLPVYALGGVGPQDLSRAQQAGAYGVAGIRAFAVVPEQTAAGTLP